MLIPPGETVVETKSCKSCATTFHVTDKDVEFYDKVSPVFNGKKENIPTPTLCPDCRQRRRLAFRNERKLYKRKCDLTGKDIVSMHRPEKCSIVYNYDAWWSDAWNPLDFGMEFDFSKSFFEQLWQLIRQVPVISMARMTSENSDYCNQAWGLKDCYLCFNADELKDCFYCTSTQHSHDCFDCFNVKNCELCVDSSDLEGCFECGECLFCLGCNSSRNLFDCKGCQDCMFCFGCTNLNWKKFYANNEQVSEDEYFTLLDQYKKEVFNSNIGSESLFACNRVVKGGNCAFVRDSMNVDQCKFSTNITDAKFTYDTDYFGIGIEGSYDSVAVWAWFSQSGFCENIGGNVSRLWYCFSCMNWVQDLFGCVSLHENQRFCILNKQYTKEEYEALVPKIIDHMRKTGEWGEFLSKNFSIFGYNETSAIEFFPLTKEEALKLGFNWSDYEAPFPKVDKIIPASKLPEKIEDIPDDILNWAIECEITKKPFRIIKQELDFYRKHNLPIPRRHPDQRHLDRLALRNPRKLFERKCDNCQKDMVTTYAPDRPERVYCEECYNKEVYG